MKNILPKRPVVLTIAGFDPSGGAGLLADIKTFESLKAYGLGVQTALTVQTDRIFKSCDWTNEGVVMSQLEVLLERFFVRAVKVGIVENQKLLLRVLKRLDAYNPQLPIVWDPVLKATTGFTFHEKESDILEECLKLVTVLTPNWGEMQVLFGAKSDSEFLSMKKDCAIYLKGGHRKEERGKDILYTEEGKSHIFNPRLKECTAKHGSGCVLSSSLVVYLALGFPLVKAALRAKCYTERFLQSNPSLLGYHKS